jgi:hypothetical protein
MNAMAATARPEGRCCSKQWPEDGTLSLVSLYSLCSGIVQQWWLASGAFLGSSAAAPSMMPQPSQTSSRKFPDQASRFKIPELPRTLIGFEGIDVKRLSGPYSLGFLYCTDHNRKQATIVGAIDNGRNIDYLGQQHHCRILRGCGSDARPRASILEHPH